jgi:DNA repair protein RadC
LIVARQPSATGPYSPAIRDFPEGERPRERLREHGAAHLSNAELMAILFRTGLEGENVVAMATRVISAFDGLAGLARTGFDELVEQRGISEAKACQLLAAIELGRRIASLSPEDRPQIGSPRDIANLFMAEMAQLDREHMKVVLLNTKNRVLGTENLYVGSLNAAIVRPAEVFRAAIRRNCAAIAVVHNHPSGDPTPSPEDVAITRRLVQIGKSMEIDVVDHLVIGQGRWVSMRERRLGFEG